MKKIKIRRNYSSHFLRERERERKENNKREREFSVVSLKNKENEYL
jgi:hypothetical protein